MSAQLIFPVCDMYENNTDIGPKIIKMIKSPNAMYLSPTPPVYKNDDDKPPKNMSAKCSIRAGDNMASKMNPNEPIKYSIAPKETT